MRTSAAACSHDSGCITCGDAAAELVAERVDEDRGLALCADGDGRKETVEIDLVHPVRPGDHLLVHAGAALAKVDAA
jgi:hydrogenase maturation factor